MTSGEVVAAQQLRAVRDNQLSFIEDGVTKSGYRLALAERRALTEQIIQLENAELKRSQAKTKIEIDLAKSLGQARLEIQAVTNLEIAKLQARSIRDRIEQKENEIRELQSLGLRTIEAELELESLTIQQKSSDFALDDAKSNAYLARLEATQKEAELLEREKILNSQQLITQLENQNSLGKIQLDRYRQQLNVLEKLSSLSSSISKNEVFNSSIQKNLAATKLKDIEASIPLEKSRLENEIKITQENQKQQVIQSKIQVTQAELALISAEEQLRLARKNDASVKQIQQLENEVKNRELTLENFKLALEKAEFQVSIEDDLTSEKRKQFELTQSTNQASAEVAVSSAKRAETEAKINRELQLQNRAIASVKQETQILNRERSSIANFRTEELNLALQLTGKEREKLKIARQLAQLKLFSLKSQLQSEAQLLAINQKQERIQLNGKAQLNQGELQQNLADILKVKANLAQLKADGASEAKIQAKQAQLDAGLAQRAFLVNESRRIAQRQRLTDLSQQAEREAFERSSRLKLDQARVEAVQALPEEKRKSVSFRLQQELLRRAEVGTGNPALASTIGNFGRIKIEVPKFNIPQIEFPDLEDLRRDVKSIVSEFSVRNQPSALNAFEGEGRNFVIQNLSMDAPINIEISGADDKEAIAEAVEGAVFNQLTDVMRGVEQRLNG